jgi:hypothetical protein
MATQYKQPNEQEVAQLKAKHGPDLTCVAGIVFRKPTRSEWDRYTDQLLAKKDSNMSRAAREIATACAVWPGPSAFAEALDRRPTLLLNEFLSAITDMANNDEEEVEVKKL